MRRFFVIRVIVVVVTAALSVSTGAEEKLKVVGMNDGLRISADELPVFKKKAERGDEEAALKLATYYGIYLNDKRRQLYYSKLAAGNGSVTAVENLVTIYAATDAESFDFKKALFWRRRLKELAQKKKAEIKSDAEWGYDLYLNHLGDKDRGLFFLKYAAKHGSVEARKELSEIFGIE
jgi:hypothetical protein